MSSSNPVAPPLQTIDFRPDLEGRRAPRLSGEAQPVLGLCDLQGRVKSEQDAAVVGPEEKYVDLRCRGLQEHKPVQGQQDEVLIAEHSCSPVPRGLAFLVVPEPLQELRPSALGAH